MGLTLNPLRVRKQDGVKILTHVLNARIRQLRTSGDSEVSLANAKDAGSRTERENAWR